MKVYLAARYARYLEMQVYANVLKRHGHEVISRWIQGSHQVADHVTGWELQCENARFADEDMLDILSSDYLLCFNDEKEPLPDLPSLGGRHAEFGVAITCHYIRRVDDMGVGLIGERTNVFHYLSFVEVYPTFDAWLADHK